MSRLAELPHASPNFLNTVVLVKEQVGEGDLFCSHFAPIPSRNRTKQEQERRINRKRGTACCRMLFPQDQRVTGHGRVVLITQRSLVQIQPPQPRRDKGLAVAAADPFVVSATI